MCRRLGWRLLGVELHTRHKTDVFVPLTHGNIYSSSADTCSNRRVLLLSQYSTCQQEVSGTRALRTGEVQEHHFPQGQTLFKINPGPVVRPTAVTACVLLFLSKQAVSLSSVAL